MQRKQVQGGMYLRTELTGYLTVGADWQGEWHEHPFDELVYICSGSFFSECAGVRLQLQSDAAVLIPSGVRHRFCGAAPNSCMLYIGASYRCYGLPVKLSVAGCIGIDMPEMLAVLHRAAKFFSSAPGEDIPVLPASLTAQLIPLWEKLAPPLHTGQEDALIAARIKEYLSEHIHEKIVPEELAASFYLSPKTILAAFRRATGQSVLQYHNRLRMEKAMMLLHTSDLRISEIADMLGFNTVQYFSSCFHSCYGISPRAIRDKKNDSDNL